MKIETHFYISQVFYILSMMFDECLYFKTEKIVQISQNDTHETLIY